MLKWTVQQRRKSAADISDDVLLFRLMSAGGLTSGHSGTLAQKPVAALEAACGGPTKHPVCTMLLRVPGRNDGAEVMARPRSASPRACCETVKPPSTSPKPSPRSPRLDCHPGWLAAAADCVAAVNDSVLDIAEAKDGCCAPRQQTISNADNARAGLKLVQPFSKISSRSRCDGQASPGTPPADGKPRLINRPAYDGEFEEAPVMCVATAKSAAPKMAKLRRLRPAILSLGPIDADCQERGDRGERRAATPDSGVGILLSESETPSDEDIADGSTIFAREGKRRYLPAGAGDDFIDTDFRIQRSSSDTSDRAAKHSYSINRCYSSPRLGGTPPVIARSKRLVNEAAPRPIERAPSSSSCSNRSPDEVTNMDCCLPDSLPPVVIPRCQTADGYLCRPRTNVIKHLQLPRRRLSDLGCTGRGADEAYVTPASSAALPLRYGRHLGQLANDWREVTI